MALWTCAEEVKRNKEKREQIFSFVKVFNNINRNKKYPVVLTLLVVFHCVIYCVTHLTHKVNFYLLQEKREKLRKNRNLFSSASFLLFVVRAHLQLSIRTIFYRIYLKLFASEFRYYYWNSERDFFVLRKKRNKREENEEEEAKSWKLLKSRFVHQVIINQRRERKKVKPDHRHHYKGKKLIVFYCLRELNWIEEEKKQQQQQRRRRPMKKFIIERLVCKTKVGWMMKIVEFSNWNAFHLMSVNTQFLIGCEFKQNDITFRFAFFSRLLSKRMNHRRIEF